MGYTESYFELSHGTDQQSARKIISEGFNIEGNSTSWCGKGAYFYDIKNKAWWAGKRKCEQIEKIEHRKIKPAVVFADIIDIPLEEIFDLRVKKDLEDFEEYIQPIFEGVNEIVVAGVDDEVERKIILRSMLISYYAEKNNCKLVIGHFRQRPQPLYEHAINFADSLDMIFGIETIYCVKDTGIICNIRLGDKK